MGWRYTQHGYDIEISDIFQGNLDQSDNYYRTSRYQEPPKSRPLPILSGHQFWAMLNFDIKVNKDAGDAHAAGYTSTLGTGVWVAGWLCLILDTGWQTAWGAQWISKMDGAWQTVAFETVNRGVYNGTGIGDGRLIDTKRRLKIGETLGPDPNDPTWYPGEDYVFASDDDAGVFVNVAMGYKDLEVPEFSGRVRL